MRWLQSEHALLAAFVASFLEMTLIPIPVETVLAPAMLVSVRRRWGLAAAALAGSVACAAALYLLAQAVGPDLAAWLGAEDTLQRMRDEASRSGFGFVFLAGVTPVPFQIACVAAGVAEMSFVAFLGAAVLARGLRYFGLAGLVALAGDDARRWLLEKKWALVLVMAAVGLLLYGLGAGLQALTG